MRGGTVILATSPFSVELDQGELVLRQRDSGQLPSWLAHHGVHIGDSLVLDQRHARFPAPVQRDSGDHQFRDVRIVDYPFFLDIRDASLARHPLIGSLPQLTMAWASPLTIERRNGLRFSQLLWSSPQAWLSKDSAITPRADQDWQAPATTDRYLLGAAISGRFSSYFQAPPAALSASAKTGDSGISALLSKSSESARIILFPSNDFLSDRVLGAQVRASGTRYLGPIELFNNTLDWALQDEQLLQIRSRGHFNRTLPPMEQKLRLSLELFIYAAALCWLLLLGLLSWLLARRRRRRYMRELGL
jgi:ABC-2 type transport system permease protein